AEEPALSDRPDARPTARPKAVLADSWEGRSLADAARAGIVEHHREASPGPGMRGWYRGSAEPAPTDDAVSPVLAKARTTALALELSAVIHVADRGSDGHLTQIGCVS